jgi:hypothetical protein
MKIILMGQQAFGKSALEKFHTGSDHEVVAVYCAPDKEGKPLDPVKEYAQSVGLPVFQPSNFKDQIMVLIYALWLMSLSLFLKPQETFQNTVLFAFILLYYHYIEVQVQ